MKLNHIVCPIDFSETSLKALRFAAELARTSGGAIHLIHAYDKPYYSLASGAGTIAYAVDNAAVATLREEINAEFDRLAAADYLQGLTVYKKLIADIQPWKFFEEIDADKMDVIVVGTRGATGILHGGLIGTNTERIIRMAPAPVISVPIGYEGRTIQRILFATDFSDDVSPILGEVIDFAQLFGAEITIGMINTRDTFSTTRFANDSFNALVAKFPTAHLKLVVHNYLTVEEGIWELCQMYDMDLIAMMTHGRTGIAHLIKGSIAEELSSTQFITLPLMALKLQQS